jgi:hypothetical protein
MGSGWNLNPIIIERLNPMKFRSLLKRQPRNKHLGPCFASRPQLRHV